MLFILYFFVLDVLKIEKIKFFREAVSSVGMFLNNVCKFLDKIILFFVRLDNTVVVLDVEAVVKNDFGDFLGFEL